MHEQAGHETAKGSKQTHTKQDEQAGDEAPLLGLGYQIPVTHGRERDQRPPEGVIGGLDQAAWLARLQPVHDTGAHPQQQEEQEEDAGEGRLVALPAKHAQ
ncbi:hypothetical protein D3C72_2049130 [compost metagenome]